MANDRSIAVFEDLTFEQILMLYGQIPEMESFTLNGFIAWADGEARWTKAALDNWFKGCR